ncbi:MAG: 5-(carboxyamino)imidazole ribonucleotide mutase [Thermoanaerobaculum sp.]|nr:5-(carboxyamino)imidazole ribonucleotide mutase [Thermoanaerobaculum sp.]MCX7894607.1 5-(carboxyamino)imidazole ribonucleotide mutase [Thermoanaerobaculum sp.]MDW7967281.1 5-(carboxyamino)imidazole ribonucleotide mutase [Thermoanaerobaculum sp.]
MAKVMILMGSVSDWESMRETAQVLATLGIPYEAHVASAHRTPERVRRLVTEGEAQGVQVFVAAAGMAAHLAGFVAAHTTKPVIGVPLPGGVADGLDALLSTAQMPGGIPVAAVAVGKAGARNAAWLAAQILALQDAQLAQKIVQERQANAAKIAEADGQLTLGN